MIDDGWSRIREEIAALRRPDDDGGLDPVTVAIFLEDATGVMLSDRMLGDDALRTVEGAREVFDQVAAGR